jgi:NAD(P)-dependent dehydrogenase (short-subunit alcohol dehydrogenase family)
VAQRPSPTTAAYGAAKAGLKQLTQTLAMEWAPVVRVNSITCGYILTEQAELFYGDGDTRAQVEALIPLGRLAMPTDIGDVAVWLASDLASYVTGADVAAHGGGDRPQVVDEGGS